MHRAIGRLARRTAQMSSLLALAAVLGTPPVALAEPGDELGRITAGGAPCGVNAGVAFDGASLYVSCMDDSRIDVVRPQDGALVRTIKVTGATKLGALAYDAAHDALYGCSNLDTVVGIDRATGAATTLFKSASGCFDGLAYDGQYDSFWSSPDSSTPLTHQRRDGTVLASYQLNNALSGFGNSGDAAGWDALYLTNAAAGQMFIADKALSNVKLLGTFRERISDVECDSETFAPRTALWGISTYTRTVTAKEISGRTCATGSKRPDLTMPTIALSADPPANEWGWNNTQVNVTLHGADVIQAGEPASGVRSVNYVLKGATTGEFNGNGDTAVATVLADGTTTITATARDWAGNVSSPAAITLHLERRTPSISISTPEEDDNLEPGKPFTARYQCDDKDSGILSCEVTQGAGASLRTASARDSAGGTLDVDTSHRGKRTITVIARDKAGNISGLVRHFTVGTATASAASSKLCGSRRKVRITLTKRKGKIKKVTAYRGTKKLATAKGRRVLVSLRGLPKKAVKIKVVGITTKGRKVTSTRTYHPCQKRKGT